MAKVIMVQGTTSNAGKSLMTAGLCRIFKQDGMKVAPFKSQNMALNSFITDDGLEMGRAQVVQAEAAGIAPDVRMNPILLKPTGDSGSQVIVMGEVFGNKTAVEYYQFKEELVPYIMNAYNSLAGENDVIVIEGAGSPVEINLRHNDFVNMGMAKLADSPVIIVADIDRGGVFASLVGTMQLFQPEERSRVKGVVINKFRGDLSILEPGLLELEKIIGVPVLGVVPYVNLDIDDEDSLTDKFNQQSTLESIDIAVIRLPKISNFTDFNPLEYIDGVSLRYVDSPAKLCNPDLIILPGTKNTMADLKWLKTSGLYNMILKHAAQNKPIFGICGGYQMLGQSISDPHGVEHGGDIAGLGLLPHSTLFHQSKTRARVNGKLDKVDGIFSGLSGLDYDGYEIHMGISDGEAVITNCKNVYGTYIHGIFDSESIAKAVMTALFTSKGINPENIQAFDIKAHKEKQYDILAETLRKSLDMEKIYNILNRVDI